MGEVAVSEKITENYAVAQDKGIISAQLWGVNQRLIIGGAARQGITVVGLDTTIPFLIAWTSFLMAA